MYTPIQLDRIRNFRYGMKAISLIEKKLNVKSISTVDFGNISMDELSIIVWAGLAHEDKELTPDKVMDLIDSFSDIPTTVEIMGKAFSDFGGKTKQE